MRGALNKQAGGGRTTGHASANRRGAASGQHPRAYPQTVHVVLATRPTVMSRPPTTRGRNLRLGRPTAAAQGQPPTAPGNKRAASRARRRCPTHRLAACTTATAREHSPPAVKRSRRGRRPPTPLPRVRGASTTARGGDKKSPPAPGVDPRGGSARQTHTGARLQGKKKKNREQTLPRGRYGTTTLLHYKCVAARRRTSPPPLQPLQPLAAADDPHRPPPRHNGKAWGAGRAQRSVQRERSAHRLVHVGQTRGRGDGRPQLATGTTRQASAGGTSWFYDRAAAAAATAGSVKHRKRSAAGGEKKMRLPARQRGTGVAGGMGRAAS